MRMKMEMEMKEASVSRRGIVMRRLRSQSRDRDQKVDLGLGRQTVDIAITSPKGNGAREIRLHPNPGLLIFCSLLALKALKPYFLS